MSEIKVNKISPRTACGTTTLGDSGDTFTIPSGVSITNQGTASGFGSTGEISWVTTKKTTGFTVTSGEGYFCDTSSGGFVVTLPAATAGNSFAVADYTNTFQTGNLTITPNGSQKIGGTNASAILDIEGQSAYFVYVDDTEGWKNVIDSTSNIIGGTYITATGGTIVTCGNFKTHIFTGPGTFAVSSISSCAPLNKVDYLVVAGGGGGGGADNEVKGGGGGAGGARFFSTAPGNNHPNNNSGASPNTEITVTAASFPITVGAAGSGAPSSPPSNDQTGTSGGVSTFSSVTSAGGGIGGSYQVNATNGGSGGGVGTRNPAPGAFPGSAGVGNTPPVAPPQGNTGGTGNPYGSAPSFGSESGGGGGGAGAVGTSAPVPADGSVTPGGVGVYIADSFVGPTAPSYGTSGPVSAARYFGGGGGGGQQGTASSGGSGGGGNGGNSTNSPAPAPTAAGQAATINTGGGGGGAGAVPAGTNMPGGGGGSGIIMIRYRFQ